MTGAEALFADMGHFNRISLQVSTMGLVYPCILASYIGQGALPPSQGRVYLLLAATSHSVMI